MLEFKCRENRIFFEYWQSLPRKELVPSRFDFFPEDIPALLPFVTIFELVSKDDIRFRLAGTEVSKNAGFERTNTNYLDQVMPERRAKASEAFWSVYNTPCATRVIMEYTPESGVKRLIEGVGLPVYNVQDGNPLLYYCTVQIQNDWNSAQEKLNDRLELVTVIQRDFIDIGGGLSDFKD